MVWTWIAGVLLIVAGLLLVFWPKQIWRIAERWKSYYADEPSDLYLNSSWIGGLILAVAGVVVVVLPYFLK
ncbi:MAG: DUF6199 family natural product biosynthesis protein [Candidatus Aphodomorpha sp.]|nr:hypothetical protein [bacterium]